MKIKNNQYFVGRYKNVDVFKCASYLLLSNFNNQSIFDIFPAQAPDPTPTNQTTLFDARCLCAVIFLDHYRYIFSLPTMNFLKGRLISSLVDKI